jgi:hypothetical protein
MGTKDNTGIDLPVSRVKVGMKKRVGEKVSGNDERTREGEDDIYPRGSQVNS